jgi:tetratricopeptide (TPR) repeat protein
MKKSGAVLLVLATTSVFAAPADDAFKAGQFAQSAALARAACAEQIEIQTRIEASQEAIAAIRMRAADACALAARATLTVAAYQTNDRAKAETLIETALADTQKALGQIPNHVEGTLQSAVALGYRAKLNQSPGIAKEAKKYMERAIVLAPNNAFASLALAGWNGEAVADIGSFIAGTVLGAKKETAYKYYEQALKLDAASPTVPVLYAFNLYRLDAKKHTVRVTQLLTSAVNLKPRDGFEVLNITHARDVLASLAAKDIKRTTALIKRHQPFGAVLKK